MKTNKEKYPNTDDALAAWKKHREECKCDCEFESWLKQPCDEDIEKAVKDMPRELCLALAGLAAGSLVADALKMRFKDEKPKDGTDCETDGVKCPMCGGGNGEIEQIFKPDFHCPDCGVFIGNARFNDTQSFREWLSRCTK